MNSQKNQIIARLFNSKTLSEMSYGFNNSKALSEASTLLELNTTSLKRIYDTAYEYLFNSYQNEYIYKNSLVLRHLLGKHSLNTSTMLSEFRVGNNKADCVIINGKTTCYEIKTNKDTLSKLSDQLNAYSKVFDLVYVVAGDKHLKDVLSNYPNYIGVLELKSNGYFNTHRKATQISTILDVELLLKSLRKDEYSLMAKNLGARIDNVPNGKLFKYCLDYISTHSDNIIKAEYMKALKRYRSIDAKFINKLPDSLKNIAVSYKFSKSEIKNLSQVFA
jgi:hypothetical protein